MARRVQVMLVDDIDGGEATETVTFSLDGVHYEIDLSESNAASLRAGLEPWITPSRRVGGRRRSGRQANSADQATMREWGRENGYQVSDRGRVSRELQDAYAAAH